MYSSVLIVSTSDKTMDFFFFSRYILIKQVLPVHRILQNHSHNSTDICMYVCNYPFLFGDLQIPQYDSMIQWKLAAVNPMRHLKFLIIHIRNSV